MINLADIHKSFGGNVVLNGLNLFIEKGEVTVVIGQSGGEECFAKTYNRPPSAGQWKGRDRW